MNKLSKPQMPSQEIGSLFDKIPKSALIDALWCACQLGTNETGAEIATRMARETLAAVDWRRDELSVRVRARLDTLAAMRIDSDPPV